MKNLGSVQCGRPGFNPWVGKIPWRRKWQPTPVFLPGKSQGLRSLAGYRVGHDWATSLSLLGSVLKMRGITLPAKVHIVKAMYFPAIMYRCESWTIKKVECQRTDALELWCWRRFLRVPWTVRRSNQSILKEINPEYSLEGLMLKLQYYGHLMWRADSFGNDSDAGEIEDKRRRRRQRMRWLDKHQQLNGDELEPPLGDSEGQRSLLGYSPRSPRE